MANRTLHIDIAIIGGGIAGLWALNQLRSSGYSAALFEQSALGAGQTIASQGIIHSGIKYALAGALDPGTETIATMPAAWRDALAGQGKVDLRDCKVLNDNVYLWTGSGLPNRLKGFFAGKLMHSRVEKLCREDFPSTFQHPGFSGQVYRLDDMVVDLSSLLHTLSKRHRAAIFSIDWRRASLVHEQGNATLNLPGCTVLPRRLILAAGAGNAALASRLGDSTQRMQTRPLQQVLVKHEYQPLVFAHCIGSKPSPRITISTHTASDGAPVWSLGGDLATAGANAKPQRLIERAQKELHELLPWVDLGQSQWRTVRIDRAEPRQPTLERPDNAFVTALPGTANTLITWPTKLTLAPDLGNKIESLLQNTHINPHYPQDLSPLNGMTHPPTASPHWDTLFR